MRISDGNENNNKNQWSNQQTNIFARAANFLYSRFLCRCTCMITTRNFLDTRFMEEISYVLTKNLLVGFMFSLFFSLPLIFNSLAASISSHFLLGAIKFSFCFPTKFVSFVFCLSLQLQFSECMNKCPGLEDNKTRPLYILTYKQ